MKNVAVIGANGFVGSEISRVVREHSDYNLIHVIRGDDIIQCINDADIVIHSANPAGRYRAENYPEWDFKESVDKTFMFNSMSKGKKFVLISSMSAKTQLYTNYGRHRRAAELMLDYDNSLTIRLGPMFGGKRKKDMLHDILANRKVYISAETKYAYVDVAWVGNQIVNMLDKNGIREIGARNSVCLADISKYFNSTSVFEGRIEHQLPDYPAGPDANDVFVYAEREYNENCID